MAQKINKDDFSVIMERREVFKAEFGEQTYRMSSRPDANSAILAIEETATGKPVCHFFATKEDKALLVANAVIEYLSGDAVH